MKTVNVVVRVAPTERASWDARATSEGFKTLSAFVRAKVNGESVALTTAIVRPDLETKTHTTSKSPESRDCAANASDAGHETAVQFAQRIAAERRAAKVALKEGAAV